MILRNLILLRVFIVHMENSLRLEISLQSIWKKWNLHRSEFHFAWTHLNANNAVTIYRKLRKSEKDSEVVFITKILFLKRGIQITFRN